MQTLESFCRELYYGTSATAVRLRYLLLMLDVVILAYFVITTFLPLEPWLNVTDALIGCLLAVDLVARLIADTDRWRFLTRWLTVLDIIVIVSLFLPTILGNVAFLRVLRALRLIRSYQFTRELRKLSKFFAANEEVVFSAINLLVFIFFVTAIVYVLQHETNDAINNYVDALYFTITTLTTTGFGDIILVGSEGRLLAVVIMIVGVALFIRLVQTIFRPNKVRYECAICGLTRHEVDAVHCKHCGNELHIRTEGAD